MSRKKRNQRWIFSIVISVVALALLVGVGVFILSTKKDDSGVKANISNEELKETAKDNSDNTTLESENIKSDSPSDEDEVDLAVSFEMLSEYNYSFLSGAGAWSDDFNIESDGYFHGSYHDTDMGDMDDDYPNGTFYFCNYEGHFSDIEKIDEYTYKMTMTDIKILDDDEEYIEDGVRYIPLLPYALDEAKEVDIYLPGKPVSELSEDIQMWLFIPYQDQQNTLESLSLVNVNNEYGITSSPRLSPKEEAESYYEGAKESYGYYKEGLQNVTTTAEMVERTASMAKVMDSALNSIWGLLKYNLDADIYEKVLEEQRQWIKERDASLAKYNIEEQESMDNVNYNIELADVTLKRCEELLTYFN